MTDSPIGGRPTAHDAEALEASISRMIDGYRFAVVEPLFGQKKGTREQVVSARIIGESPDRKGAESIRRDHKNPDSLRLFELMGDGWYRRGWE